PSTIANPIARERPEGRNRTRPSPPRPALSGITVARVRAACWGRRSATGLRSPPAGWLLRKLERPEKDDFVLEAHSELLGRAPPRFGHQRDRVGSTGGVGILDEVRVAGRDLRAADPVPFEATRLEHSPRG